MKKLYGILSLLILSVIGCEEETPIKPYPELNTLPVTNISQDGVQLNAEVVNPQAYSIKRYGFVWSDEENPTLEQHDQEVILDGLLNGVFSAMITSRLRKEVRYYVRAFIETEDYLVYGTNVSFEALGSGSLEITSVYPSEISYCDTLYIRGHNFSNVKNNNKITFGPMPSETLYASDTLLKTMVPARLKINQFNIAVNSSGSFAKYEELISLKTPTILSYEPTEVALGAEFIIRGENFPKDQESFTLLINGIDGEIIENSCQHIKAVLPAVISSPLIVTVSTISGFELSDEQLVLQAPTITSLLPDRGYMGNQVEIQGYQFNLLENPTIQVGNLEANFEIRSNNTIVLAVPKGIYNNRANSIIIFSNGQQVFSEPFEILDPWIQKTDIPADGARSGAVGFSIGDFGYVGLGQTTSKDFWKYSPSDNSWVQIADFPGWSRTYATTFVIGNYAYVGGGWSAEAEIILDDFWRYDMVNDNWSQVSDFPYAIRDAVGLSEAGVGYVSTRSDIDNYWSYNPATDSWTKLPDLVINSKPQGRVDSGFELNGKLYVYVSGNATPGVHELYQFDPISNLWSQRSDIPIRPGDRGLTSAISVGGHGYVFHRSHIMHQYDSQADAWTRYDVFYRTREHAIVFEINGKAYFGGGNGFFDLWEYDPRYQP